MHVKPHALSLLGRDLIDIALALGAIHDLAAGLESLGGEMPLVRLEYDVE